MIITAITLMDLALVLALDNLFFRRRRTFRLSAALGALGFICFTVSMAGSSAQGTFTTEGAEEHRASGTSELSMSSVVKSPFNGKTKHQEEK